jgi:steroid delta-isomerase-like uncharacterized protein
MGIEENKELARRVVDELLNQRKLDVIDEIFAEDCVDHQGALGPAGDRESLKLYLRPVMDGFPGAHFEIINLIAEGDMVLLHLEFSGTHSAEFVGVAASGKHVKNATMTVFRIGDGRIAERWGITDPAVVMQQITAA